VINLLIDVRPVAYWGVWLAEGPSLATKLTHYYAHKNCLHTSIRCFHTVYQPCISYQLYLCLYERVANLLAASWVTRRVYNAVCTAVTRLTHVASRQTASCRPEVALCAWVASASCCIIAAVDTLAASADVVSRRFWIQSLVVDTAGGMSVALTRLTRIAMCGVAITERLGIV